MVEFLEERVYNTSVHLGNWLEDQALQDEKIRDFLDKRDRGELLLQKQQKLNQNFFSHVKIDVSRDGFVHFGDKIVIKHPGFKDGVPRTPCLVAASLGLSPMTKVPVCLPCDECVSSVPRVESTIRTTFVVKGITDTTPPGKPLTFGEEFEFRTTDKTGGNLRLYSARRSFTESSRLTTGQVVKLVSESSRYTRWRILSLNTGMQRELKGHRVPANIVALVNHVATNHNLCLERSAMFPGIQGAEFEVTTHSLFNGSKQPMEANHWILHLETPKFDDSPAENHHEPSLPSLLPSNCLECQNVENE